MPGIKKEDISQALDDMRELIMVSDQNLILASAHVMR